METTTEQVYKNWMEIMGLCATTMFNVGKELAGETFLQRVEEMFYQIGLREGRQRSSMLAAGETDCIAIGKVLDAGDESLGNYCDGYVENSPAAFEKHITTCPVAEILSMAPEICTRLIAATAQGLVHSINPDATIRFDEIIAKGDKTCHYRVQLQPR